MISSGVRAPASSSSISSSGRLAGSASEATIGIVPSGSCSVNVVSFRSRPAAPGPRAGSGGTRSTQTTPAQRIEQKHDPDRVAVRHGHESGEVTLGGRRVGVERPRVRSADGRSELPLETYAHFADRDPLTKVVLERMLAGVSTRRYRRRPNRSVTSSSRGRGRRRSRRCRGCSSSAPAARWAS